MCVCGCLFTALHLRHWAAGGDVYDALSVRQAANL